MKRCHFASLRLCANKDRRVVFSSRFSIPHFIFSNSGEAWSYSLSRLNNPLEISTAIDESRELLWIARFAHRSIKLQLSGRHAERSGNESPKLYYYGLQVLIIPFRYQQEPIE
jgi:hypothetical protein